MKYFKKICYYTLIVILVAFGLLFLSTLIPLPGSIEVKVVQSGSMRPAISLGDSVVIYPTGSYDVGDVITFGKDTGENVPTTHRIVNVESGGEGAIYTTKGDANNAADGRRITEDEIIGEVVLNIPYLGHLLSFARSPIGFLVLIVLPVGLVMLDEVRNIARELRRGRDHHEGERTGEDL